MSRESEMIVIERDSSGTPTVWCDPEIVDLVTALNAGGLPTIASCSGHGEKMGRITLKDGRELLITDYETATTVGLAANRKVEPTRRQLLAMAAVDGYHEGDRDMPGLQRWRDYWVAAAGPSSLTDEEREELRRLRALINTPHTADWIGAVELEAAHQQERWGAEHDAGKDAQDWFWLLGYLGGKALASFIQGDREKGLHHIVSSGAVLLNWHRNVTGHNAGMRPGIADPDAAILSVQGSAA